MGIQLELVVLLVIAILGPAAFAVFELETPWWRKALKWFIVAGATLGLYQVIGHWSLALPLGLGALGTGFHFWWCRANGIDPLRALPRRKYYALRRWEWPGD